MSWRHAVLEIYEPEEGWPTEGTPADWIENNQVGYCDGDVECLVVLTPVWKLVAWKLRHWLGGTD
jgi:hypothetical protein